MKPFDFLILGSGIAGLSFALKVAPHGRVAIVTTNDTAITGAACAGEAWHTHGAGGFLWQDAVD